MISIIIPTQNRCFLLEITLNSLIKLIHDFNNIEILIIDNASTDHTKIITERIINQNKDKKIYYIYEPIAGLQSGRQKGASIAKGDILVFIDDDIVADTNWINAIDESFKEETVQLVGGRCLPNYEIEPPYWTDYLWTKTTDYKMCGYYSLIDQGDVIKETDPNLVFGLNFAIRKLTLFDLGGFNPDCIPKNLQRFQGDGESGLTRKLKLKKYKAIYNPKALVYHAVPKERMTIEYIEKRMYYQGVCDSYSKIRSEYIGNGFSSGGIFTEQNNMMIKDSRRLNFLERVKNRLLARDIKSEIYKLTHELNKIRIEIENLRSLIAKPNTQREIEARMKIAYQRGFEFHQKEVNKDPKLLEWVIKENYFDYDYTKYE